jgi:hypothetical protein
LAVGQHELLLEIIQYLVQLQQLVAVKVDHTLAVLVKLAALVAVAEEVDQVGLALL